MVGSIHLRLKLVEEVLTLDQSFCSAGIIQYLITLCGTLRTTFIVLSCYCINNIIGSLLLLLGLISRRVSMELVTLIYHVFRNVAVGAYSLFSPLSIGGFILG